MLRQRHASSQPAVSLPARPASARRSYLIAKRCMDVAIAGGLVVILSPLFAVVALLIKLDSRGEVFFKQERMGSRWAGDAEGSIRWTTASFKILKFRSMRQNADQSVHESHIRAFVSGELETEAGEQGFKLRNDMRVTRVGKLIRRTSVDELPQLVNVVRGEMSLVGPRPVPIYEVEGYQQRHFERLQALPGITGFWQVHGRSQVSFEDMVAMDIWYVRNASLWLDLKILCLTLPAVLRGKGAA